MDEATRLSSEKADAAAKSLHLEETISEAIMDVDDVEQTEIVANQWMIYDTLKKAEDVFKFGLGRLFGNNGDVEEMEEIAEEVTVRLEDEVHEEIRMKSDKIADQKAEDIEEAVEEDEEVGMKPESIEDDVKKVEKDAVSELKREIDEVAKDVKSHIQEKALEIE